MGKLSIGEIEQLTGLSWNRIEELAELIATQKDVAFMLGLGFQKSMNGAHMVRAVSLLPALLGLHRGYYYTNSKSYYID